MATLDTKLRPPPKSGGQIDTRVPENIARRVNISMMCTSRLVARLYCYPHQQNTEGQMPKFYRPEQKTIEQTKTCRYALSTVCQRLISTLPPELSLPPTIFRRRNNTPDRLSVGQTAWSVSPSLVDEHAPVRGALVS